MAGETRDRRYQPSRSCRVRPTKRNTVCLSAGYGGEPMSARIDFLEEAGSTAEKQFNLVDILDIADQDGPDLAFLRVEGEGMTKKIDLATRQPERERLVA